MSPALGDSIMRGPYVAIGGSLCYNPKASDKTRQNFYADLLKISPFVLQKRTPPPYPACV